MIFHLLLDMAEKEKYWSWWLKLKALLWNIFQPLPKSLNSKWVKEKQINEKTVIGICVFALKTA